MKILGLIPARGGSKAIPHKNIALLQGKPLLAYTAEAALGSKLDRVLVSTNDTSIADTAKECGLDVLMRPEQLAEDDTPMLPVMEHVLEELKQNGEEYDAILLLQPTSPLRTAQHINEAIDVFTSKEADTLVSVMPVPHQFLPQSQMKQEGDLLVSLSANPVLRRQDKEQLYARNGPAILLVRTDYLLREKTFYGERCVPYVMDARSSVDIDGPEDLAYCEYLLQSSAS